MDVIKRIICFGLGLFLLSSCSTPERTIHLFGSGDAELIQSIEENFIIVKHETLAEAIQSARPNEGLLILASGYPEKLTPITRSDLELIREKKIRTFLEYPACIPGQDSLHFIESHLNRLIINTQNLTPDLDSLDLLVMNGLHYILTDQPQASIVSGRVAGFDQAVFGTPKENDPILFDLKDAPIRVATTSFSQAISARYAPSESWQHLWESILTFLFPDAHPKLRWESRVQTTFNQTEELPANAETDAVKKGIDWFARARMLPSASILDTLSENGNMLYPWRNNLPQGDGSQGVLEAIMSVIDLNGRQPIGRVQRWDCTGETAMAFAAAGSLLDDETYSGIAQNILDYYLFDSKALQNEYGNPKHPAYGLIPWGITNYAWYRANYGDDNARGLLGWMVVSGLTGQDRWDETMMRDLVALLRTTGTKGFRGNRIDLPDFERNGWQYYHERNIENIAPHFESYLWACYLWAYNKTGYAEFLEKARSAITITMENFPDGWRWTNGLAQEKARMLLCLSWLVRVDDQPQHRQWFRQIAKEVIQLQDDCGAIREELGDLKMGRYPPPQSNEQYGTNEASLLGKNGDPVSDLLYTTNFAFLGLHEAVHVSDDPDIRKAYEKLADFLCRIQVKAPDLPEIDGGWFRAFDFGRWELWGCNADHGWGAWCIESGWTQGWITTILALKEMNTSIWDLSVQSEIGKHFKSIKQEMGL